MPATPPPLEWSDGEEVELWWGSYAPRTMAPSFILCALFTVALVGLASYVGAWTEDTLIRNSIRALAAILWLFQLVRWCYRITATNYRLTSRRLICTREFGLRSPPDRGVALEKITQVLVSRTPVERLLNIGRLGVFIKDGGHSSIVLDGVYDPERVALMIRRHVKRLPHPAMRAD